MKSRQNAALVMLGCCLRLALIESPESEFAVGAAGRHGLSVECEGYAAGLAGRTSVALFDISGFRGEQIQATIRSGHGQQSSVRIEGRRLNGSVCATRCHDASRFLTWLGTKG